MAIRPPNEPLPEYEPSRVLIPRGPDALARTIKAVLLAFIGGTRALAIIFWLGWWLVPLIAVALVGVLLVARRR